MEMREALSLGEGGDSDDDHLLEDLAVCVAGATASLALREDLYARARLVWSEHVTILRLERRFGRYYRMNEAAFEQLAEMLRPRLVVDGRMSTIRTGEAPISPEVVLHCTLRWLAGGSYLDVCGSGHLSVPSFYRCLHKGVSAILSCPALGIRLPTTASDIEKAATSFTTCSTEGVFDGCVGCVDGMLVRIKTPSTKETRNVRSYFSGHYHAMGLNVQAACDYKSRFIFFSVAAPGGSSDIRALRRTSLAKYIEALPGGRYMLGDGGYVPSEHLLTPFGGSQRAVPANDGYNFFLSQLRIKIEQAFGFMTTKWRRLRSPLQVSLKNASRVVVAIARLHNYCIDHRQYKDPQKCIERMVYHVGYLPSQSPALTVPGVSEFRNQMVSFIRDCGLSRPQHNLQRKRQT